MINFETFKLRVLNRNSKHCLIVFSIYLLFSACSTIKNNPLPNKVDYAPNVNIENYKLINKDSIKLVAKGKRVSMIFRSTKKKLNGYYKFEITKDTNCYVSYPRICSTNEEEYYCTDTYFVHLNNGKLDGDWFGASYANKKEGIITLKYELFYRHKKGKLTFIGADFDTFDFYRSINHYYCEKLNNEPASLNCRYIGRYQKYIYPEYLIK